jgi:hypothetical protein
MITAMTRNFIVHIRRFSVFKSLCFNFSGSFCIIFLSDDIATSVSKQMISVLLLSIMSALLDRTCLSVCLSVCTPLFYSTILSSCVYQFSAVLMTIFLHIECILYHFLWCIHSLEKWSILYTVGNYFQFIISEFFFLKYFLLCAWSWAARSVISVFCRQVWLFLILEFFV